MTAQPTTRTRPGVWVGMFRDQHLRVNIVRRYPNRLVCRVTEPGEYQGQVCDFHPADVIEGGGLADCVRRGGAPHVGGRV